MTRNVIIILVLTVSATAAGAWAGQVNDEVDRIKAVDVIASQFRFEPATISVVEGDTVRLRLRSADRTHGIGIKAFRVKALIPRGEAVIVEFVADRAGTFDITCSEYCGTGHRAMKGKLIVRPSGSARGPDRMRDRRTAWLRSLSRSGPGAPRGGMPGASKAASRFQRFHKAATARPPVDAMQE